MAGWQDNPLGDDSLDGPAIPDGKWPQTQPDGTVAVVCPNAHPAGVGFVATSQLGVAICLTDSAILVPANGYS